MLEVRSGCGLLLSEVSEGVSVEEVRAATGCNFEVSDGDTPFFTVTISLSVCAGRRIQCPRYDKGKN